MAQQQRPQHVGEALEQARSARTDAPNPEARHEVVLDQIADALIRIQWAIVGIGTTLTTKMK